MNMASQRVQKRSMSGLVSEAQQLSTNSPTPPAPVLATALGMSNVERDAQNLEFLYC